jgi:hypothetical protein
MFSDAEFQQLLASASPEELEQLMGMGTLDEKGGLLEQQMAQAQALRSNHSQGHSTGLGAGLGGLADILNGYASGRQQKETGEQQQALLAQKDSGRNLYADLLRRGRMKNAGAADSLGVVPNAPVSPFGLG